MDEKVFITTEDCVDYENKLYFFSLEFNLLCCIDKTSSSISIVSSIPEEDILSKRLCSKIILWKDALFLVPLNVDKLWKYDISSGNWSGYEIKNIERCKNAFMQAVIRNEKLYLIGCHYPAIIVFDLKTEQMKYVETPFEEIRQRNVCEGDFYFRSDYAVVEDSIYLACCNTNAVLRFSFEDETYELFSVGIETETFIGMDYQNGFFWLAPGKDNYLVKWDGKDCIERIQMKSNCLEDKRNFGGCICYHGAVIGWSFFGNSTIVLEWHREELKEYEETFKFMKKNEDGIIMGDEKGNICIFKDGTVQKKFCCVVEKKQIRKYFKDAKVKMIVKQNFITEGFLELEDFLADLSL